LCRWPKHKKIRTTRKRRAQNHVVDRGGKPGRKSSAAPAKKKPAPGRGAARLRTAINSILDEESGLIARALVNKTVTGNMARAGIVVALADTKLLPKEQKKKHHCLKLIDLLESEPEWEEPPAANAPAPGAPFAPFDPTP
jgi:hypothetical protein